MILVCHHDRGVGEERGVTEATTQRLTEARLKTAEADVGRKAADREQRIAPEGHRPPNERIDRAHALSVWRANGEAQAAHKRGTDEVGLGRTVGIRDTEIASVERVEGVWGNEAADPNDCGPRRLEAGEQARQKVGRRHAVVIDEGGDRCARRLKARLVNLTDPGVVAMFDEDRGDVGGERGEP